MADTQLNEAELREALKRCPEDAIKAAVEFNETRNPELVPTIVLGIIERFVEPDLRPVIREAKDNTRLLEDLGIDSLLMVEIVILVEETLNIQIENDELRNLRTVGDIKSYLDAKLKGLPIPQVKNFLNFEQLAAIMPHQPPFLFLQEARLNGESAEGSYQISGDEAFLEGHFKDNPVFPASLMLEALGQLAVAFILKNPNLFGGPVDPNSVYFISCDGVRCHKVCKRQDTLKLQISLKKIHAPLVQFEGRVLRDDVKVAKADAFSLSFALANPPESPES